MNNPTMENVLNLALDATPQELARSEDLNVGFDSTEKIWELIVKYSGSLTGLSSLGVTVTELLNEYAILTVPESLVERLALVPEIEYIEKPKRLFFSVNQGKAASCIPAVQNARYDLYGDGVLVALLDSGVDYAHPDFRNEDGTTRILALWDQTIPGRPPEGYRIGTEYTQQEINEALAADTESARYALVPSRDVSGHGTRVLGIAAGNGRASGGRYRGIASRSPILAVKLGMPREEGFPRTTELMQGLDYCIRKALELRLPVAVNISIGNTYGAHDGTSLLETYIADIANVWKSVICIGTGNEGYAAGHAAGILQERTTETVELAVGEYETAFSIQIWKSYLDEVDITLISPGGRRAGPIQKLLGAQRFVLEETEILLYYGEPSPYSQSQEIYLELLPRGDYVDTGIWTLELAAGEIRDGHYHIWLPSSAALNGGTRFLRASADTTLTIPSTARRNRRHRSLRQPHSDLRRLLRSAAAPAISAEKACSRRPRRPYPHHRPRRHLRRSHRHLLCHSLCHWSRRSFIAVGDRRRQRSLSLWRKGDCLSEKRNPSASGVCRVSESGGGVGDIMCFRKYSPIITS